MFCKNQPETCLISDTMAEYDTDERRDFNYANVCDEADWNDGQKRLSLLREML